MNILPRKSIIRMSLVLGMALVILIVALFATIKMSREKMENYAEAETEQKSVYVNALTNMLFLSKEWVVSAFLSGMLDITFLEDSAVTDAQYKYMFDDDNLKNLNTQEIYERLESFINYNSDIRSAILIFEPNVIKDAPDGIAASMHPFDKTRYNLLENYEIYGNSFYKRIKNTGRPTSKNGKVSEDSIFVSSYGVSLCDKRGHFIGEFWVDTDAMFYSNLLLKYRKDKDAVIAIIDSDCRIIASTNVENNGRYLSEAAVMSYGVENPEGWYQQVREGVMQNKNCHFSNEINGEWVVTYLFPIMNSSNKLLVIKPEKTLYTEVNQFMWIPYSIMFVSVLMISLCLVYIFFTYKKKDDENDIMEGELNVAAAIQRGILPQNPISSDNSKYDIYGFQRQAKTVGGDLYDFVHKGDLLHFCIGDVSGKGMPAALVMTELCSLYRYIIRYNYNPRDIMTKINKALMERSDDTMFCTLFVGVLNLKTGLLEFCNAGHNPPIYIRKADGHADFVKMSPNMPVYAFENYVYKEESLQMEPGDRLLLYTDGVTEAMNDKNEFYGRKTTLETFSRLKTMPFEELVDRTLADMKTFSNKTEQNDDITILCIEYKKHGECVSLHFDNVKEKVTEIVNSILDASGVVKDMKLRLAIEEPVQNIADYAYETDGALDVEIEKGDYLTITLIDGGKPFNPLECKVPDFSVPVLEREIGGLGIYLTREVMNDVTYQYVNKQNRLKLKYKKNEY